LKVLSIPREKPQNAELRSKEVLHRTMPLSEKMYFDIDFPHYRQRNREDMQAWKAAEGQH
jgi:hypothetical protein